MDSNTHPSTQPFLQHFNPYQSQRENFYYLNKDHQLSHQQIAHHTQHNPVYLKPQYPAFEQTHPQPPFYQPNVYQTSSYASKLQVRVPIGSAYLNSSVYPGTIYQGVIYPPSQNLPPSMSSSHHNVLPNYTDEQTVPVSNVSIPPSETYEGNQMSVLQIQNKTFDPQQEAKMIEDRIKNDFTFYTCLLYIGLIGSVMALAWNFFLPGNFFYKMFKTFLLTIFLKVCMNALKAKYSLNSRKQLSVFFAFIFFVVVQCITAILYYPLVQRYYRENSYGNRGILQMTRIIFGVIAPFFVNVLLACYARSLCKLMKRREHLNQGV